MHEVENSQAGAKRLYDTVLKSGLGAEGVFVPENDREDVGRIRSWVMPYRAIVLLCRSSSYLNHRGKGCRLTPGSHKRRDKRCSIAAPLLRAALVTCLEKHDVTVDETGGSLINLSETAVEDVEGTDEQRAAEIEKQKKGIEGVDGGDGGEVGIFNINHLGGHRYAGVMLVSHCAAIKHAWTRADDRSCSPAEHTSAMAA